MPQKLRTAQRGALGDARSAGHAVLQQHRDSSRKGCTVLRAKALRANDLLCQLPFHPSLGTWAKWMKLKDFTCAAASLLLISKTFGVGCCNDSGRQRGCWMTNLFTQVW